ncbi:MAG: hypothetical protein WCI18_13460 [Pseudomonadota bacterium]
MGSIFLSSLFLGSFFLVSCKNDSIESKPEATSVKNSPDKKTSTYVPVASQSPFTGPSMPDLGKETTCATNKLLVAGYCLDLVDFQVFSKGEAEFYTFGDSCKTNLESCGVPAGFVFKETRFRTLINPPEALKTLLSGIEELVKNDTIVFTTSASESAAKVKNEGFTSKGFVAWLLPFPADDGKQMVRFEKEGAYRYGLTGYSPGEAFLGTSLGYASAPK